MENIIITVIVALIVSLAGIYVYREKKKGKKCIGCPSGGSCTSGNCQSCTACTTPEEK